MTRTRVKICGITREQDLASAVRHGADAIGPNFYPRSPRCLELPQAQKLASLAPPFVIVVALFVNPDAEMVRSVIDSVRPDLLQFHGDETPEFCAGFGLPHIKAARMKPGLDLLQYARDYSGARGLLLDAHVAAYGGVGASFDWSLIPPAVPLPIILSGGLNPENVAGAVRRVKPWAVDVSTGVESAKGIKDDAKIAAFCKGVRHADL
jgi:phosphoribosylanthranilate isomerase